MSDHTETQIAGTPKAESSSFRSKRLRILSTIELSLSLAFVMASFVQVWLTTESASTPIGRVVVAITNPITVMAGAWVVLNGFSYVLDKSTVFVGRLDKWSRSNVDESERAANLLGERRTSAALADIRKTIETTTEALVRDKEHGFSETESKLRSSLDLLHARLSGVLLDPVEVEFGKYLLRSSAAASTAQRRPNALLFIGVVIAVLGLGFFFATLKPAPSDTHDPLTIFLDLLPRLLSLIFIQLLAGFFLKQYRASMEDFRYYESVLRHREAQYLSYVLRKKTENKESLASFAAEIMEDRQSGLLAKGQTTTTLEAQRLATNEFAGFYESLFEAAVAAKDKVVGADKKAREKKGAARKNKSRTEDTGATEE